MKAFSEPRENASKFAYVLTPGLAQVDINRPVYGLYPHAWNGLLKGCAGDKQLLWGGISTVRRKRNPLSEERSPEFGLLPQRAFVPPGTVYVFGDMLPETQRLLPQPSQQYEMFQTLNYGKLLWGKR